MDFRVHFLEKILVRRTGNDPLRIKSIRLGKDRNGKLEHEQNCLFRHLLLLPIMAKYLFDIPSSRQLFTFAEGLMKIVHCWNQFTNLIDFDFAD